MKTEETKFPVTPEEIRHARNAYFSQWRRRNPDKVKQYSANYWRKKAEQLRKVQEVADTVEKMTESEVR